MDGFGENIKKVLLAGIGAVAITTCLLYTSPSPRDTR